MDIFSNLLSFLDIFSAIQGLIDFLSGLFDVLGGG